MPDHPAVLQTRFLHIKEPLPLCSGQSLPGATLAYETYGSLNADHSNAILLFHAMTGSQHAAGFTPSVPGLQVLWTDECQTGWWDSFIGPGKALDTEKYFIICANYLGGCYGSTGPASTDPSTGKPFGSRFPRIGIPDIVESQLRLLDHFGISRIHAAIGSSIGGLLTLALAVRHPERLASAILIGTGAHVSPLQRILNFEQVTAIECDPAFSNGDYYPGPGPVHGLTLARMIAHKTFISLDSLGARARNEVAPPSERLGSYILNSCYESYMLHQGKKFVPRFDANSYLLILEAWQRFNLPAAASVPTLAEALQRCAGIPFLLFSISSDVCFYPDEQDTLADLLHTAGAQIQKKTILSDKGHDSFLVEPELYRHQISAALDAVRTP
jgi:homoserine O-acetyltransferase